MPVMISSTPKDFSFSCTTPLVRVSCSASSGCACRSWRHSVISRWNSAMRLMIGMADPPDKASGVVLRGEGARKTRLQRHWPDAQDLPHGTHVEGLVFQQAADFRRMHPWQARHVGQQTCCGNQQAGGNWDDAWPAQARSFSDSLHEFGGG